MEDINASVESRVRDLDTMNAPRQFGKSEIGDLFRRLKEVPAPDGGYFVPPIIDAELHGLMTGDPRPAPPRWWQPWKRAGYRKDDAAWQKRWGLAETEDAKFLGFTH